MSFLHQASQSDHQISVSADSGDANIIASACIAIGGVSRVRGGSAAICVLVARASSHVAQIGATTVNWNSINGFGAPTTVGVEFVVVEVVAVVLVASLDIGPVLLELAVMRVGVVLDLSIVALVLELAVRLFVVGSGGRVAGLLVCVVAGLSVLLGVLRLVLHCLISVSLVGSLMVIVLELVSVGSLMLGVTVMLALLLVVTIRLVVGVA